MGTKMKPQTATQKKKKVRAPVVKTGCCTDKGIFIRCTREGRDAYEAVYPATLREWSKITGLEDGAMFDCADIKDEALFDEICERDEVDVRLSELDEIPFVVVMY
jgi:hypothetical protein